MQFNKDINGLRALAVVAVVLFHFAVPGFQGGFVGVDVFFVISGYLMTGIVIRRMTSGSFSVWQFYADRARRIVPALLVLCVVLLVVGWFLLLPSDYRKLGKQVGASLTFLSNVIFWREAGYFAAVSHRNWLLHTWSLSVEWQFYMLYPLLVAILRAAFGLARVRWLLLAVALCSLGLSVYQSARMPSAAFFLLPTRTWELLLGALVYLFPLQQGPRARLSLEATGLVLVGSSVVVLNSAVIWPGWLAIVPTLGTALVIWSKRQASPLFGNPLTQWLGRSSYSIYLWHWPVVVGLTQLTGLDPWPRTVIGIMLSLLLGWMSFQYVESPTRRLGRDLRPWPLHAAPAPSVLLAGTVAVAILGGAAVWATNGAPWRVAPAVRQADMEALNINPRARDCFATSGAPASACHFGDDTRTSRVEMLGDSHAMSLASALAGAAPDGRGGVNFRGYASCPTLVGATYGLSDNRCFEFNRGAFAALARSQDPTLPLVITNNWTTYVEEARIRFTDNRDNDEDTVPFSQERFRSALLDTLCGLSKFRRVYVTLPLPQFAVDVPRAMAYRLMLDPSAADLTVELDKHQLRNVTVVSIMKEARDNCGVRLLDPTPYLCPDGRCKASIDGRPLYFDEHHLSEYGNRLLIPMFRQVFADD